MIFALLVSTLGMAVLAEEKLESIPREESFYINGLQWGPGSTWNPLAGSPDWPCSDDQRVLIYETLFAFNMLNNKLEPLLATGYSWLDDYTVRVKLDEKAHWQNGEPLTAEDVVYTFELADKYSLDYSDFWDYVDQVKAVDKTTVDFTLNKENPNRLLLLNQFGFTNILPKSVFEEVEKECAYDIVEIRKWTNENPIGSGPYRLYSSSNEKIVLKRYDEYWGIPNWGKPAPKYIVHPIYKSNDAGNRAFEKGQIDMSQQFIPRVWEMWLVKDLPVKTWYDDSPYFVPAGMPSLIINHNKAPLNDKAFREALAYAIDYEKIAQLAMTRYSETMKPGFILPKEKYFDEEDIAEYGWEYNPEKAEQILEDAGYIKGSDGKWKNPDGSKIGPLTVECPYGWTDWMVSLKVVAMSAQKIGLDLRTEFPEFPPFYDRLQHGDFDFMMWTPAGQASPAQPWLRFRDAIYSGDLAKQGEMAFRNFGRYRNEEVNELIKKIPTLSNEDEITKSYKELNIIFMQDIPIIPLEYRPWLFHTWFEKYWTGFPTADNPYAPPQIATDGAGIRTLFNIKPAE